MSASVTSVSRPYALKQMFAGRASDWAGFIAFAALAVWTIGRAPLVAIFLLPTIASELLTAIAFLIRAQAKARRNNVTARMTAYGGTFVVLAFVQASRSFRPELLVANAYPVVAAIAFLLWLTGSMLAVRSVWALRHSFSIEPQARGVVRSGPYKYVRHPIYLSYILQNLGLLLIYPSQPFAFTLLIWLAFTLTRMRYEEQVLASAFPEYSEYRCSTGALLPMGVGKLGRHPKAASI